MNDNLGLKKYTLVQSLKKSGKVTNCMDALGKAMLIMWALKNTPQNKQCIIFEAETGLITARFHGNKSGFPTVEKDIEHLELYAELVEKKGVH